MTAIQWQRYGIISDYLLAELKSPAYSFLLVVIASVDQWRSSAFGEISRIMCGGCIAEP